MEASPDKTKESDLELSEGDLPHPLGSWKSKILFVVGVGVPIGLTSAADPVAATVAPSHANAERSGAETSQNNPTRTTATRPQTPAWTGNRPSNSDGNRYTTARKQRAGFEENYGGYDAPGMGLTTTVENGLREEKVYDSRRDFVSKTFTDETLATVNDKGFGQPTSVRSHLTFDIPGGRELTIDESTPGPIIETLTDPATSPEDVRVDGYSEIFVQKDLPTTTTRFHDGKVISTYTIITDNTSEENWSLDVGRTHDNYPAVSRVVSPDRRQLTVIKDARGDVVESVKLRQDGPTRRTMRTIDGAKSETLLIVDMGVESPAKRWGQNQLNPSYRHQQWEIVPGSLTASDEQLMYYSLGEGFLGRGLFGAETLHAYRADVTNEKLGDIAEYRLGNPPKIPTSSRPGETLPGEDRLDHETFESQLFANRFKWQRSHRLNE